MDAAFWFCLHASLCAAVLHLHDLRIFIRSPGRPPRIQFLYLESNYETPVRTYSCSLVKGLEFLSEDQTDTEHTYRKSYDHVGKLRGKMKSIFEEMYSGEQIADLQAGLRRSHWSAASLIWGDIS